jgi:hypothetical protein
MTKIELAEEQIRLQGVIQSLANINIVTCGNCGSVVFHELNEENITCYACTHEMAQCDCPDYWYEGMSMTEFEDEPIISSEFFILPSIEDVVQVATDLKMNPSIAELKEVLKYYPNEELENPTWHWESIVENMLYNYVQPPHTK